MKNVKSILTLITFLFHFKKIYTEKYIETSWTDPITGSYYDWSVLKKSKNNPYIIKDSELDEDNFSLKYYFNIGDILNQNCNNKTSSVIQLLEYNGEKTEICEILGHISSTKINLLDYNNPNLGIVLEYGDGDICKTSEIEELMGLPRKTRFKIYCSKKDDYNFILDYPEGKQGTTKCILDFKIYSTAGCPKSFLSKIKPSRILLFVIIIFILYIIFGYYYNKIYHNLNGKAAIPNYIFWRRFPWLVIEGIKLIIEIYKRQINKLYRRFFYKKNNIE